MPAPYGITPTGFNAKTLAEIKADLEAGYRGTFGAGVNLEPSESTFGSEIGIMSERLAEAWQALQAVYNACFPDGSEGVNLANIGAITGVAYLPATRTKAQVTCTAAAGGGAVTIPINSVISVAGVGAKFRNALAIVIPDGGTVSGEFSAVETGPIVTPAGSLTVIETPVSGWLSATNPLDATIKGTNIETDAAFRLRRESTLRALGTGSGDAIRALILEITNVTDCFVFTNTTDAVNVDGLPPHSLEVVVDGGDAAEIAAAIYSTKSGTDATYGTSTEPIVDAQGFTQNVLYSRPAAKNIYVQINAKVNGDFPVDGVAQIKALIAAMIRHTGESVAASPLLKGIGDAPGVEDLPGIVEFPTLPLISFSASPTLSTTLTLTHHEKAAFDTSRVTVVLS